MKDILPAHIGIIMDGNGRWAKMRGLPRIEGHRQGEESIMEAVRFCAAKGIRALSLFAFSTENWERPPEEVRFLVNMSRDVLRKRLEEFMELGVRLRHLGRRDRIPEKILAWFDLAAAATAGNRGLNLNINFNYGGRREILDASLRVAEAVRRGELSPDGIDENSLREFFYAPDLPDIDLLIRTAGEMRISNFMLWHLAKAEILVTPVLWPDFGWKELEDALEEYRRRKLDEKSDYHAPERDWS
ncbi:polyprenyl diphosphate synthase [Candidatus Solincola tengchongensis]|uniref:polyprenyl diphosphate synthase n=1 Tax=Candidatus Solincola tengchongensis TaxID=2900693 RepID=UPI00257B48CA|nr:polyprenyl diphosphate synthase [Candidatus Solincola tengchongensis]